MTGQMIARRPTMKNLLNITELIIIVCVAILIVLAEIAYYIMLRARDKVDEMIGEIK